MSWLLAARVSATLKASTAPAPSSTSTSAMEIPTGPRTVSDVEWLSFRPSFVQMAPLAVQLVVSGRVIETSSAPGCA